MCSPRFSSSHSKIDSLVKECRNEDGDPNRRLNVSPPKDQVPSEHLALRFIPQFLTRFTSFSFSESQRSICDCSRNKSGFRHIELQIGRSSDNRRFCSPNYSAWRRSRTESLLSNARLLLFVLPLAPASLARSAHLAPLTTLRPRWGLALVWLMSSWCRLRLE